MRVNLLLGEPGGARSGYLNLDPLAAPDDPHGRTKCDLHALQAYVDANEAVEIISKNILERYTPEDAEAVMDHWVSRLAHGGQLSVQVADFRELARAYLGRLVDMAAVNHLLLRGRQTAWTLESLVEAFAKRGLKIIRKLNTDMQALVIGVRP